jgi:hypothetical protein
MSEADFQQELIELFDKNIKASYTINQISKLLKKPYAYTHGKIKKLVEQNIIKTTSIGNSLLCVLNINDDRSIVLLTLNEIGKKKEFITQEKINSALVENINSIKCDFDIYTVVLNHSSNELFFVIKDNKDISKIKNALVIKKYSCHFSTLEEFKQTLVKSNLLQNHVVLYSFEKYFEIIQSLDKELQYLHSQI